MALLAVGLPTTVWFWPVAVSWVISGKSSLTVLSEMMTSRGSSAAPLLEGSLLDDSPDVLLDDSEAPLPFPHAGSERATTAAIKSTASRSIVKRSGAQGVLHRFVGA